MLKISNDLLRKLTIGILVLMIISIFFGESSSNSKEIGETIFWFHARSVLSFAMLLLLVFTISIVRTKEILVNFKSRKDLLILSLIFISLVLGFVNSDNYGYIFQRMQIKIPFLILPLCAGTLFIDRKGFQTILFVFLMFTFSLAIYTFINYIINFNQINASYLNSKVMPSPINHIRFSILLTLATYSSLYLLKNNYKQFKYVEPVLIFAGIFLFVFIHLYSVRSGIIALYAVVFTEILIYIIRTKSYKKGLFLFLVFIFGCISIFTFSPTLKNKIINTKNDISIYNNKGNANYNSLSTRLISYEIAIDLFKENVFFGCGLGDLEIKNTKLFKEKFPEIETPIIPHNEFLYYLASMGVIGFLTFGFCFFFPLFYNKNYKNDFLLMVYIVLFLSFMTEPMIENQLGVAVTIIFITLPLMIKKEERFQ